MLIQKEDLNGIWKMITADAVKGTRSVMIFVSNNCDALSALRILTNLLKQSNIQYTCIPVFGYSDIESNLKEDAMSSDIRSLIFLNCGGKLDFTQYWFYQQETEIKTFLFDSQRPIFHSNILTQKAVYVVDDGDVDINECPDDADLEAYEEDIEEKEDKPIVDGEKEYQLIINGGKKSSVKSDDGEGEEEEEEKEINEDEEDFDPDFIGKKRKRPDENVETNSKRKRQMRITNYYSGDYYSKSCSYLLYSLGVQLNKQTVDSFWLWILGLTDQLVHSRITSFQYDEILADCQKEYMSISNQNFNQENSSAKSNQQIDPQNDLKKFDSKGYLYSNIELDTDNISVGSIFPQYEFRFMFLRSWTLYKSVYYSNYVVSKLRLWEDVGRRELNKFFAMLGIPPDEYNQQYRFMNLKYKNILRTKITEIAPKFELDHILFSSFVRQIDSKTQLNASDMVYAITSILESPRSVLIDNVPNIEENKDSTHTNKEEDKDIESLLNQENIRKMKEENFWVAYSALDISKKSYINYGIELSKEMQCALMSQGILLLTNKKVKPSTKFRYCIISNDSLAEAKIFQYPLAIQKLALFIMDVYKESRNRLKTRNTAQDDLPMVVCVRNSERDSYLVAGVLGRDTKYARNKNEFGNSFQEAANKVGATYKHDGFDASIIEIKDEHFEDFLDELIQL